MVTARKVSPYLAVDFDGRYAAVVLFRKCLHSVCGGQCGCSLRDYSGVKPDHVHLKDDVCYREIWWRCIANTLRTSKLEAEMWKPNNQSGDLALDILSLTFGNIGKQPTDENAPRMKLDRP